MFCDKLVTTDARQISITKVEKDLPLMASSSSATLSLESAANRFPTTAHRVRQGNHRCRIGGGGGKLTVTRWRAGKAEEIVVTLPVLGTYGATAPFDCAKSKRILEQGCKALAEKVARSLQQDDPIVRSFNALALLASGDPAYLR